MKSYWDSSALIETLVLPALKARLINDGGFTRTHSLAETFSTLSGNRQFQASVNQAAETVRALAQHLDFVDLTSAEIVEGLAKAQSLGVRGGRVHDYLHALAAKKSGAKNLLTMDRYDFDLLVSGLTIEQI